MKKRVLSLFMALALCLTLLPTAALAEENPTEPSTQLTEPTPVPQEPKTPDQGENTETPDQPEEPSQDEPPAGADAPAQDEAPTVEPEPPAADEQPAVQSEPAPQAAEVSAENAVAQVGNVNYANITDAFAAVKENGGTLTLLANCKTPNTSEKFDISGNYTLDLNDCTLTGWLNLSETSMSLTVKDSGTNGKIQATGSWPALWADGGDVTIESGTLATQSKNAQALVFGDNDACKTLTITGGSFETGYVNIGASGGKTVISGGAFHELRVNGDSKRVTLSGGTFDTVKRRKNGSTIAPADLLKNGYVFVNRDTGAEVSASQEAALTNVKVVSQETVNALASLTVDGTATHYGTFEKALDAAQQTHGGTLTLLNHVTTTQTDINSGTFTLDLNGHTLTSGYNTTLVVRGGSLTIQDSKGGGVISSTSSDGNAVWCGGRNVTILGGSFPSALHWESGTVSLQGGAFRSLDSKAGSWLSAIPERKALKKDDDHSVVDASAKTIHTDTGFYVLADHEHDWQAGRCACGREHTDHKWKDGECTVCHLPCSHGEIGGDGVCKTCGTQFTVKAKGTYYKHLSDALASENVDDVTLLADDTLSADVKLIKNIMFFPNGHTVSGGGSIVVPSGKRLVLNKTGNAGAIRVEDGGTLMVDEGFTGTVQTLTVSETADVKLSGGTYGTITGSRQKAGTLLNYNTVTGEKYFAFQKQDGTFARYDQRIPSETPLENVTVVGCPDKQLTEACGETCEYCGGALRCRIGAAGYRDMSDAIRDVPDGGTITLLRDYSAVTNISANVDRAYTIDLNGHSVRKNSGGISLAVYAGTPKIIDSKGGGVIAGLEIDSKLGLTLADLLPEGYTFKSGSAWISDLSGTELTNVSMAKIPIKSMNYPTEMSMTYGDAGTLLVNVKKESGTGAVRFQWYKVEDGKATEVGSATAKNQFDLSALKLPAGQHTFRFSATCDGYKKMSQDIAVTVQRASISASRITPPTAQENLTYTGQKQALITAGSVTSGGTMQYSLTENGTYSQDIPVGTDAGTYTVWYRVIGDANHNDTAPASVAVSIGRKPLTLTKVTAVSKPYDGTTNAGITSVTFDGVTLIRGTDYNVTASFEDASVGNNKMVTATVTLMEQTAKNYALEQSSFMTTGSITKAAAPDFTKEAALVIVNDCEKTYTVTLPTLPELETPKEYGAPTYELGEIKLNDGYYTSGAKVENGKLTLPIQKNDVETTGSVGTVTVVIKSTNYEDITLTVNISAKNKLTPVLAGTLTLTPIKITYGEPLSKIKITGTMKAGDTVVEGTFSWQQPGDTILDANTLGHNVGWKFTPKDGNTYTEATGIATVKVDKAQQYGKLSMAGYTYGQAPSTPTLTDRTGDLNAQVTYGYAVADSGSVQTWDISNPPALNAGTYSMFARIGATSNYNEYNAEYCEFVVAKATPTYTAPTGLTAKYGQTLADVKLSNPEGNLDGTWSWMNSSESVGDASTVTKTFQAKFIPTDTDNYNMVENIELEVMVNKADGRNLKTVELEQKYTDASEHTYTPDWLGLPSGQTWRYSSEYSVSTGSNVTFTKRDFAADGSLLTYAVSGGKAGDKITLTLKASCDNYGDFTITLNIPLTEKDDQKPLTITGDISVIYGEKLTLTTTGGSSSGAVTYRIDPAHSTGDAAIDPNTGVLTPVKVGSVSVVATKAGDNDYNDVTSAPFVLMIKPATPTGEPSYTKITTSGKTLKDAALTTNGSTLNPNDGKLEWVDDKGNVLPDSTRVEANTTYKWRFTPTDTNYTTLTGEIELWHKSTSSGGGSYYAPVVPDMPMLYRGCTGDAVKTLQEKLNAKGFDSGNVDGIFGVKTYAAVTAFQKANGLGVDGIVGKLTWGKLYGVSPAMPVETTTVVGRPMVSYGSRGDTVRKLQELLNALGYDCGSVDGIFGSKTKAAVLAFQKANGLGADGIVGPLTWGKLV